MEINMILRLDNLKKKIIDFKVRNIYGPDKVELSNDDVIVLCLVKNGGTYIKNFIKHYFDLGARHIVFLDNGSSDNTVKFAKCFENVTILETDFPFKNPNEMIMRDYLIERFAKNHWSLCVDIDEFFDYPFSDKISLKQLIRYMNENSYTALVCHMLDLFPISISRYSKSPFSKRVHRYYDISAIKKINYYFDDGRVLDSPIKIFLGGIRKILFNRDFFLVKHALLFKNDTTIRSRLGHLLVSGNIADFTAVLFHYKFTRDFFYYVEDAVNRGYHYRESLDHKHYHKVIFYKENLIIKQDSSKQFKDMHELLDNEFVVVSQKFRDFVHRNADLS